MKAPEENQQQIDLNARWGIVYQITSPVGKSYIGQTRVPLRHRWSQHCRDARERLDSCPKLAEVIREHGPDTFTLEELWQGPLTDLDSWEAFYIGLLETMAPNGYNLTTGGNSGNTLSDESAKKQAVRARQEAKTKKVRELPVGVTSVNYTAGDGFRVRCKGYDVMLTSGDLTLEEKRALALETWHAIEAGTYTRQARQRPRARATRALPKYIYLDSKRNAYFVQKPGHPRKFFMSSELPMEEKLRLATQHLDTLQ